MRWGYRSGISDIHTYENMQQTSRHGSRDRSNQNVNASLTCLLPVFNEKLSRIWFASYSCVRNNATLFQIHFIIIKTIEYEVDVCARVRHCICMSQSSASMFFGVAMIFLFIQLESTRENNLII